MIYSGLSHEKWWFSMFFCRFTRGYQRFWWEKLWLSAAKIVILWYRTETITNTKCDQALIQPAHMAYHGVGNRWVWLVEDSLYVPAQQKTSKDFGRAVGCVGRLCKLCTATQQWTIPEMPLPNIYIYNYINIYIYICCQFKCGYDLLLLMVPG